MVVCSVAASTTDSSVTSAEMPIARTGNASWISSAAFVALSPRSQIGDVRAFGGERRCACPADPAAAARDDDDMIVQIQVHRRFICEARNLMGKEAKLLRITNHSSVLDEVPRMLARPPSVRSPPSPLTPLPRWGEGDRWALSLPGTIVTQTPKDGHRSSLIRYKPVSHPRLGDEVARMAGINLDLAAQLIDEDPQILGLIGGLPSPHRLQQSPMRNDFASIVDQVFEYVKFLGSQPDFLAADNHTMFIDIDGDITNGEHAIIRRLTTGAGRPAHAPTVHPFQTVS